MVSATSGWSPVTMITRSMPAARSARIARGVSGRIGSSITSAPASRPSTATNAHDEPSTDVRRRIARAGAGSWAPNAVHSDVPIRTDRPSTVPAIPEPGSSTTSDGNDRSKPRPRAARTIDAASTCGETWSREAASRSTSSPDNAPNASTSLMVGTPPVSVPVLSNSRTRARLRTSSAAPPLKITPRRAAREIPATMAIGAARISGHGVATTRTDKANTGSPLAIHAAPAIRSVTGTNNSAYRSAIRTNGALLRSASRTKRAIAAYVLSPAAATARRSKPPPAFTTPLRTRSPTSRSTSRDSPVRADSSKVARPATTTPSTGTISPAMTRRRSPGTIEPIGGVVSAPSS